MQIEEAIRARLLADPTLQSLVDTGVHPQESPQDTPPPYVLYSTANYQQEEALGGGAASYLNLYSQDWRFDCYGGASQGSYRSAKALALAVRGVVHGGMEIGEEIANGSSLEYRGSEQLGGDEDIEPPVDAEGRGIDYVSVVCRIWWRRSGDDGAGL